LNDIHDDDDDDNPDTNNHLTNKRIQLLDVWIDYQKRMIRQLDMMTTTTTISAKSFTPENGAESITRAAEQAHNLLEAIVPFLGARSVWLHPSSHHQYLDHMNESDADLEGDSVTTFPARNATIRHATGSTGTSTMTNNATTMETISADALQKRCEDVLTAWAHAMRLAQGYRFVRGIPQRAQFLLERMEASCENTVPNKVQDSQHHHHRQPPQQHLDDVSVSFMIPPTIHSYNRVLETWAFSKEHLRGAATERVFQKLVATNKSIPAESYQLVMTAWALSNDARFAYRSSGYLMKMLRIRDMQLRNDHNSLVRRSVQDLANIDIHGDELDWEPTLDHYHMVFKAWSHSE
jgi:hypothetical protein